MSKYAIRAAENGTVIEECDSIREALSIIDSYEQSDRDEGIFEEGSYEVYDLSGQRVVDGFEETVSVLTEKISDRIAECKKKYLSLRDYQDDEYGKVQEDECYRLGRGYLSFVKYTHGWEKVLTAEVSDIEEDDITLQTVIDLEALLRYYDGVSEILTDLVNEQRVITATKRVKRSGNSLMVSITDEANILGVDIGDIVEITIRRA